MLVCNYCGRNLKNDYESCPGCGAGSFKKIEDNGEYVIKKAPSDGYKVNLESMDKQKKMIDTFKIVFLVMMLLMAPGELFFVVIIILIMLGSLAAGVTTDTSFFGVFAVLIPFIIMILSSLAFTFGIFFLVKMLFDKKKKEVDEDIKRVEKLSKEGMLVKNMPYTIIPYGEEKDVRNAYCIQVMFKYENGTKVPLTSNPRYGQLKKTKNNTVDLLIDEHDYTNYFIDFEIY